MGGVDFIINVHFDFIVNFHLELIVFIRETGRAEGCGWLRGRSTSETTGSSGTGGAPGAVRALRVLTVANAFRAVTAKLVHVSVDIEESQASEIAELKTILCPEDPSIELKGEGPGLLNRTSQPGREMSGFQAHLLVSWMDWMKVLGKKNWSKTYRRMQQLKSSMFVEAEKPNVNAWKYIQGGRCDCLPKPEWGSWESLFHQTIPKAVKRDFYYHDRLRGVLVRFHAQERRQPFVPSPGGLPESVSWASLTGRRRTFHRGVTTNPAGILEDAWNVPHPKPARQISTEKWIGRTEFELRDP
ncbi:unnamed protein product [Symbiodinium microadriaticum]|nr:unnamed protein product [Symbiodinium sp. KB8]CAE7889168.1 unnamed protein product [Symbiodinium microadriaticum]